MIPNPELMELYGTDAYYLEKAGEITPLEAAQVAAPLAFLGVAASDKHRQQKLLAEAEMMNQAFRMVEAQRMQGVKAGFGGKVASALDPELEKAAAAVGRRLARETNELLTKAASGSELSEMEKEALVGLLGKGLSMLGKGLGGAGKSLGWGATGAIGRGGMAQSIGGGMRRLGAGMARKGGQLTRGAAAAAPAAAAAGGGKGLLGGLLGGGKSKGLFSLGTKAKLGLGALGLGAGYAGFKGLQAARDYMMVPTSQERWGRHGVAPAHGVSPYGYVTPRM